MEPGFIEWAVGQSGITGLAAFSLFMLRYSYVQALAREREYADANREDKQQLLKVLNENTTALIKLTTMIEALRVQSKSVSDHNDR